MRMLNLLLVLGLSLTSSSAFALEPALEPSKSAALHDRSAGEPCRDSEGNSRATREMNTMLGEAFGGSVAENYREVTAAKTASKTLSKTCSYGGAGGNRTRDLLNAIQALSQLSYGPNGRRILPQGGSLSKSREQALF